MENLGETIDECQICKNKSLHKFLSLGHQPPSDNFLSERELKEPEISFPLDVYFCDDCKLVQLGYAVNPSIAFTDKFIYTTGSSGELVENFKSLAEKTIEKFKITSKDFVLDIGSNDGTLLKNYSQRGIKVLGVDPSKAADLASEKNISTLKNFFDEDLSKKISESSYGKAKLITSTNVFAHVHNINSFMKGIYNLLQEDGVFIEESHYLDDLISKLEYDSIYAEHLRYYSLKPLTKLFEHFGMEVFDAEKIPTHGGSLRVYARKKSNIKPSKNVANLINEESGKGLYNKETFDKFAEKVYNNKQDLTKILSDLKRKGKKIVGLGAPAKGNTLLNYCKIGNDTLEYLAEKPNLKIGMYSPGMHLKVVDESNLFKENVDYALLLAWNLKDFIVPKVKNKGFNGKFIIPNPKPHII